MSGKPDDPITTSNVYDYSSVSGFSDPNDIAKNINLSAEQQKAKQGPAFQYARNNTFGLFNIDKTTDKKKADNNKLDIFMSQYTAMHENNYDTEVANNRRYRDMFLNAVTNPKQFLQAKNQVAGDFENQIKEIRNKIFLSLIRYDIAPVKARRDSDMLSKMLLDRMMQYLNEEMYPTAIESKIQQASLNRGGVQEAS